MYAACPSHCCPRHGCKYGYENCPVGRGRVRPQYGNNNGCEYCADDAEYSSLYDFAWENYRLLKQAEERIEEQRIVINKRNYWMREKDREISWLKGRITSLKRYGRDLAGFEEDE